jgi:hypothetical protein
MYKLTTYKKDRSVQRGKIQTWSCGDELAIDKFYDEGLGTCCAIFVDELDKCRGSFTVELYKKKLDRGGISHRR